VVELTRPVLHTQAARAVLPIDELEDAGQSKHAEVPVKLLYFPALHCSHTFPDCVHPILHKHTEDILFGRNTFVLAVYILPPVADTHLSERPVGIAPAFTAPDEPRIFASGTVVVSGAIL